MNFTCGDDRDKLIQEYIATPIFDKAGTTAGKGEQFVPACMDVTNSAGTLHYPFPILNASSAKWDEDSVSFGLVRSPEQSKLEAWVSNYPAELAALASNYTSEGYALPVLSSGYRSPDAQYNLYQSKGYTLLYGRHTFGDAIDLANPNLTDSPNPLKDKTATWYALYFSAYDTGASFIEKPLDTRYGCSLVNGGTCVHADWRNYAGGFAQ